MAKAIDSTSTWTKKRDAEYRQVCAAIERFPRGRGDDAIADLEETARAVEERVWAKPAETLEDVLLRAKIALRYANDTGTMAALDNPTAYCDERAFAQLIRAVVDVLGKRPRG